jgi:hypothetical protein
LASIPEKSETGIISGLPVAIEVSETLPSEKDS